jgi:nitrate/nitrite-specific signal transduction histidine kinase
LTFTVILCTIVFRMTHRIYGPLVSIERFVEQIARGEYQKRVTIRRGDELKRLADKLNVMAEELQKRHGPHFTRRAGDADPQSSPPEQLQP